MHSENHRYELPGIPIRLQAVTHKGIAIGKNCWIGAKATILDGVKIGNNSIVAAGAVVTEGEYEDFSLLAGVPARKIKSLE
jgi:acetyltransferase-like isoleucine patch superfamily enzyme